MTATLETIRYRKHRSPEVERLLIACRVPEFVQTMHAGDWIIERMPINGPRVIRDRLGLGDRTSYVGLFRKPMGCNYFAGQRGECVMEESDTELSRHLPILLRARGDVLVSGLGLGCVVRGLLAKPEVGCIDVIESDPHIVETVGPWFEKERRVNIHYGDAQTITWSPWSRWDYAWHDVWSETEPLQLVHARIMVRYKPHVAIAQGAWQFPREAKRRVRGILGGKLRDGRRP